MSEQEGRWHIRLTRQAEKALRRVSKTILQRLDAVILSLAENPRPPDSQLLVAEDNLYRLTIDEWRVIYAIEDEPLTILILEIAPQQQPGRYQIEETDEEFLLETATQDEVAAYVKHANQPTIRVLIASDRPDDREALQRMLFFEAGIEIVGAMDHDETLMEKAIQLAPDVIILNVPNRYPANFEICRQLYGQSSSTSIIIMSVFGDGHFLREATLAGAKYTLIKPFSSDELIKAIRRVSHIPAASSRGDFEASFLRRGGGSLLKRIEKQRQREEDQAKEIKTAATWLKLNKLGHRVEMSLSVADLATSLAFYEKLGLEPVDGGETPYPWATLSDGTLHLGLHQQTFASPTITYFFTSDGSGPVHFLKKLGIAVESVREYGLRLSYENDLIVSAEFEAYGGQQIVLANKFMRAVNKMPKRKFLARYGKSIELSLPTADVPTAVAYWQQLGFEPVASSHTPYTWTVVSDGQIRLGLHQTTKFTKPTITYFSADIPGRLDNLQQQGVHLCFEHRDHEGKRIGALVESPEGQPFFLFTSDSK